MSFTADKRENIKIYLLEKIEEGKRDYVKKTAENFGVSVNTVYRYLNELKEDEIIFKSDGKYELVDTRSRFFLKRSYRQLKDETKIYIEYIEKYLLDLKDNVQRIWTYSFTEMMNNAIDHSGAEDVELEIVQNELDTVIVIKDSGRGIFKNLMEFHGLDREEDAIWELFKGKITTDSANHSGEGIFFTSKAVDNFAAISNGNVFSCANTARVQTDFERCESLENWEDISGTAIYMRLANNSERILKNVFDRFATVDEGFIKTSLPIRQMVGAFPVSRSQARRLCRGIEKFQEVELDFSGIEEIGQGFAHEIFTVFANKYPQIKISAVNTGFEAAKMIKHASPK